VKKTSIFIVPRSSNAWRGNEAGWITSSGWAAAGQELWTEALVATTDGVYSPQESMLFPRRPSVEKSGSAVYSRIRKLVPEPLITAYKDIKLSRSKPGVWPIESLDLTDKKVMMVWERHDLFPGPGRRLADRLGVPLVISAEAAIVWEANKWGVKRPIWGNWLERNIEAKSLKGADLVSCVSEEVREKIEALGVPGHKVIVSHNRVDSSIFHPGVSGLAIAKTYKLDNRRVVGWTGSFRSFHGLDTVVKAFKRLHEAYPDTVLMLVGDGLEFARIEEMAREAGLAESVILPGRQRFTDIPSFLANFTVALVSASSSEGFHYSPLKLREYLATGKAVIAPRAGNLPELFKDGKDLIFYDAGNVDDLADKMKALLEDAPLVEALEENAKSLFAREGTWVHELRKVCDILGIEY